MNSLTRISCTKPYVNCLIRFLFIFATGFFLTINKGFAIDISRIIDSIEQQNLYAHDTVKIKNYILLNERLAGQNPDTAFYFINKALQIDSINAMEGFRAKLLLLKAQVLKDQKKYNPALEIYKKAIKQAEKDNNNLLVVEIYRAIGMMYIGLNLYDEAFSYFISALKNCDKNKDPENYSTILNNLGYVYQLQNKYDKALEYFNQSLKIYASINDKSGMATSYNNIGASYFYFRKYDSVLVYFGKSLKTSEEIQDKQAQTFPIFNLGETYYELNQYDTAISYILKAYEIDKEFNDKLGMAQSLNFLGKIYSAKGDYNKAQDFLEQALQQCIAANDKYELKEIYFNISKNYSRLQQYKKALHYNDLYTQLKDSLINTESTTKILELETKYKNEQQLKENEYQKIKIENQQIELHKQVTQKTMILGGFFLLLVFFIVIYRNYRLKTKSNALLREQKEQIEAMSEKMHLVDKLKIDFFTNVSHEFRTPLTVILGLTDEINETGANAAENRVQKTIRRNALRLNALVCQLLDLRKIDDGHMEANILQGNIPSFIARLVAMLESLAIQKGIALDYYPGKEAIIGYFDPDKLEKIVINLVSNAIKFSNKGDRVKITLGPDETDAAFIKLIVEDSGAGIPPDQTEFIFKPFFQASNSKQGSGIGLALTKEMIELLHGTISVISHANSGSCFTVRLPVNKQYLLDHVKCREANLAGLTSDNRQYLELLLEEKKETNRQYLPAKAGSKEKPLLLVVEDHHDLKEFVCNIFKDRYQVEALSNGKEALEFALENIPEIIISDVMMPEMDGTELCKTLKNNERTSHVPVILLTAKSTEEDIISGLECGADDYIVKPFSAKELSARVNNIVAQREKLREKFSKELDKIEPAALAMSPIDKSFLEKAIAIVEQNMAHPDFGPSNLVEKLNMSRSLVFIKLKNLTGQPASGFISSIRLRAAARILKEHEKNISETAYAVGFSDQTYFNRLFKKTFNKTPTEYMME